MTSVAPGVGGAPELPDLVDLALPARVIAATSSVQEALELLSDPDRTGALLVALDGGVAVLSEGALQYPPSVPPSRSGQRRLADLEQLAPVRCLAGTLSIVDATLFAVSRPSETRLEDLVVASEDGAYATVPIDRLLSALADFQIEVEDEFRMSEAKLAAVVAGAPFVLWATDADGVFTVSEGRGLRELGLGPGEVIGKSIYELYGDEPAIMEPFRRALGGEVAKGVVEVGGAAFETLYWPLWSPAGEPRGVIGVSVSISDRINAQRELEASERRAREIIETANDAYVEIDGSGRIVDWNAAAERLFGCPADQAIGLPMFETFLPRDVAVEHSEDLSRYLMTGASDFVGSRFESVACRRDGTSFTVEVTVWELTGPGDRRFSALITDITERKSAEQLLRRSEERFRSLIQNSADGVLLLAPDLSISYISPSGERILGLPSADAEGLAILDCLHAEDRQMLGEDLKRLASRQRSSTSLQARMRDGDGAWRWIEATATNLFDDPNVSAIVLNFRDVSDRARLEQELRRRAFSDQVTGLPNRIALEDRIRSSIQEGQRPGARIALVVADVNGFEGVLEALGHAAGEQVLRVAAARLRAVLRPSDVVARLDGHRFAVLLDSPASADRVDEVASRILGSFDRPVSVDGREVSISLSCGVAVASVSSDPTEILLRAEMAVRRAKTSRRIEFYVESMGSAARDTLSLRTDLARALERNQLSLHYQPITDIGSLEVVGFEALLRWNHPERGPVPPAEFIPIAESTGSILEIGRWVMREACREAAIFGSISGHSLTVSVNLSARQFEAPQLISDIESAVADSGLDASGLIVEITESLSMRDTAMSVTQLRALRALGVRIALDDFGTGYSSLAYLPRLPVDLLKIDKRFVQGVSEEDTRAVVRAILSLAQSLGLRTVAEGVEKAVQLDALRALGCDLAQGFFLHRPMTSDAARELIATGG